MGKFINKTDGIKRDELFGGSDGIPVSLRNIEVSADAQIKRGQLLAADKTFGVFKVAASGDTNKVLVIAAENFDADEKHTTTSAYTSGKFNRQRILVDEGINLDDFEQELRKQNIFLSELKIGVVNLE